MGRYSWGRLNPRQVGRFSEYFVKMELALWGFEVYTSEVDDRGIDFVARHGTSDYLEIQVKSVRNTKYVFMQKSKFPLSERRILALVLLDDETAPSLYLIPATEWLIPNCLLVDRNYEGLKSQPEWGVQLSGKSRPLLKAYEFEGMISKMCKDISSAMSESVSGLDGE